MNLPAPDPVISGIPYVVVEVDGTPPDTVGGLAAAEELVIEGRTGRHVVRGEGSGTDDGVRFHEKAGPGGKDVRVWNIRRGSDGVIVALSD